MMEQDRLSDVQIRLEIIVKTLAAMLRSDTGNGQIVMSQEAFDEMQRRLAVVERRAAGAEEIAQGEADNRLRERTKAWLRDKYPNATEQQIQAAFNLLTQADAEGNWAVRLNEYGKPAFVDEDIRSGSVEILLDATGGKDA